MRSVNKWYIHTFCLWAPDILLVGGRDILFRSFHLKIGTISGCAQCALESKSFPTASGGGCQVTLSETEVDKRGQQCLFFPSNHNNEALCLGRAGTFYANNPVCATSKNSSTMDDGHGLFKKSSQIARLTHVSFIFLKTLPLLRQLLVS